MARPPSGGSGPPWPQRTVLDRIRVSVDVLIVNAGYVEPETLENKGDFINNNVFLVEAGEYNPSDGSVKHRYKTPLVEDKPSCPILLKVYNTSRTKRF